MSARTAQTQCRSCGAPVVWAWVVRGSALPDRRGAWQVPFDAQPGMLGTAALLDCAGDLVAFEGTAGGQQHASHFLTCPQREAWRRRRTVEEAA